MGWWIGAILVWLVSAACIISTIFEVLSGKKRLFEAENFGAYIFHGSTAILALWLLVKALG
ncbi:MAG: hypothetical protein V2A78_00960 [bacterium]